MRCKSLDSKGLDRWLAGHEGVVTRAEVAQLGGTKSYVQHQLASGAWRRVGPGVYAAASAPTTAHQSVRIALAGAGPDAVASHLTASWLWRLVDRPPAEVHITVPPERRPRLRGAQVHRSRIATAGTVAAGLRCTPPLRTLIDCATVVPPEMLGDLVDRALAAKLLRADRLARDLATGQHAHCRGVDMLRRVLEDRGAVGGPTPSMLESRAARLMKRYRVPVPKAEYSLGPDGGIRIDHAFPDRWLAIEWQGAVAHASSRQQRRDHVRENRLNRAGWTVLKYDWKRVVYDGEAVAAEIAAAYAECGARAGLYAGGHSRSVGR
ncbi:MAG: DUF559 domain-containing protein [Acidimicrobiaceae bacterium]|nr:DUF559 domain-containing protein [Acidimicrobiaceae bacterium]